MARSIWDPKLNLAFEEAELSTRPSAQEVLGAAPLAGPATGAPFPSPVDWRNVWIYMIMTDRFNNPDRPPKTPWDHRQSDHFQGGTFEGVRQQLDYLEELGVGAIWLSPVLKNCVYFDDTYHGYGIQDFVEIDPRLASDPEKAKQDPTLAEAELRALVDDAHARGIYVIFDIVLNHTGDVFAYGGGQATATTRPRRSRISPTTRSAGGMRTDAAGQTGTRFRPTRTCPGCCGLAAGVPAQRSSSAGRAKGAGTGGDFVVLKQMVTDLPGVHARGRPALPGAQRPDPRLPVPDRQVRRGWLSHRHAQVRLAGLRADLRQRHPRVCGEHRQAELLHVRRGLRRRGEDRGVHRPQHVR